MIDQSKNIQMVGSSVCNCVSMNDLWVLKWLMYTCKFIYFTANCSPYQVKHIEKNISFGHFNVDLCIQFNHSYINKASTRRYSFRMWLEFHPPWVFLTLFFDTVHRLIQRQPVKTEIKSNNSSRKYQITTTNIVSFSTVALSPHSLSLSPFIVRQNTILVFCSQSF